MKRFLIFMMLLQLAVAHSQKQDNIWYFGNKAGLDFNSGSPLPLSDGMIGTIEGVATISDTNGNLLFYTDGVAVYNKNHQLMQNGIGLLGHYSSSQSAIIIQKPGSTTHYYIFTNDVYRESSIPVKRGVHYSEVNMTANNGLGAVINKNVPLLANSSEHLTATYHYNGKDIWIVAHGFSDNIFHSFLITENGLTETVTSASGTTIPSSWPYIGGRGIMKISPTADMLAISYSNYNVLAGAEPLVGLELFQFDNKEGILSDPDVISYDSQLYGVEFSGNSKVLYVSRLIPVGDNEFSTSVSQFNLEAVEIGSSQIILAEHSELQWCGALQMAVDGKIYYARAGASALSVINNPDAIGFECGFVSDAVALGSGRSMLGLPSRIAVTSPIINVDDICITQPALFSLIWSTQDISTIWNFGDGNTSSLSNPAHTYNEPGIYTVRATVVGQGNAWSIQKEITVLPKETLIFSDSCENDIYILSVGSNSIAFGDAVSISWSGPNGFTDSNAAIAPPAAGEYTVSVTPENGCPTTATYNVDSVECFIPRGISPNGDGLNESLDLTGFNVVRLEIFNRYGSMVYDLSNYVSQWHGQTSDGTELVTGTYYYRVQLPFGKNKTGWIYINRQL